MVASNPNHRLAALPATDVAALRNRLGLDRAAFAAAYGWSVQSLYAWERGGVQSLPARCLLHAIAANPSGVALALSMAGGVQVVPPSPASATKRRLHHIAPDDEAYGL